MSLIFAALLAATFAVPGHAPQSTSPGQDRSPAQHSAQKATKKEKAGGPKAASGGRTPAEDDLQGRANEFLTSFIDKGEKFAGSPGLHVLFGTVSDPVETHLAGAFDHDVAALQDAVQDSGYLFDSSWIPWEVPTGYDSIEDNLKAEEQRKLEHGYPGILLFRNEGSKGENPYTNGLVVFLLAEKPTAGIAVEQAKNAMAVLADLAAPSDPFPNDALLIAGPGFSGSLHSLLPVVSAIMDAPKIHRPGRILVRSSGFTSCGTAAFVAKAIAQQFNVDVDMGSALHPIASWTGFALRTLEEIGIERRGVAIVSEAESLFGESVEDLPNEGQNPSEQREWIPKCNSESPAALSERPWNLEFPRDIAALRYSYEKQGLLEPSWNSEQSKRSLHLDVEEARNGDSIRIFGGDETVAEQESVLFGISEFIRSHGVHAAIIVATSEEDSYFMTRFLHANNSGIRLVVIGATRLFTRGSTSQFRGDLTVSSFPLLPRLYDWTKLSGSPQDQTEHIFPNESSSGEYVAVRDLLWGLVKQHGLTREYSRPDWNTSDVAELKPPVYISALGGGAAWPVSSFDTAHGSQQSWQIDTAGLHKWSLRTPFPFGSHVPSGAQPLPTGQAPGTEFAPKAFAGGFSIRAPSIWKMLFAICIVVPLTFCFGIYYADPVRRRKFAYLQPPVFWQHWILLVTVPALLSQASFLLAARQMTFPSRIQGDHHGWYMAAITLSVVVPGLIVAVSFVKGSHRGCFESSARILHGGLSIWVFELTALALTLIPFIFVISNQPDGRALHQVLHTYREMHWDSGVSLLPTIEIIIFALAIWNYEALIGISVLHERPRLPKFPDDERISDKAAHRIAAAGRFFPWGAHSRMFWVSYAIVFIATATALLAWPSFHAVTSLSAHWVTTGVLVLAALAFFLMLLDMIQFAWLWAALRDLLLVLNSKPFKRSFIPLRDFNWSSVWSFSGGSFQEKRKVLAAQVACAFELHALDAGLVSDEKKQKLDALREQYSKLDVEKKLGAYRGDLKRTHKILARIGSNIAKEYGTITTKRMAELCPQVDDEKADPFRDEKRELERLPTWLRARERFLCLLYLAFIRIIIARLRNLAISIVSVFSLVGVALAVYPFQPMQPLFFAGAATLLAIAVTMFVVFSQMDKDPTLARILASNPNKLEWSFYGKFIDILALPLLTLLSSLLPGGTGRLLDLLRTALSHAQ